MKKKKKKKKKKENSSRQGMKPIVDRGGVAN
jgi:hypothetical protein